MFTVCVCVLSMNFNSQGFPDLVVMADMSPFMTLMIAEVKIKVLSIHLNQFWFLTEQERVLASKAVARGYYSIDSQLGQVLFYLVAQYLKTLVGYPYPKPCLGVFMAEGNVSVYKYITHTHTHTHTHTLTHT